VVVSTNTKSAAVRRLSYGAASLLAKRNFSTETLLLVFQQECGELGVEELNKKQFIDLMGRLLVNENTLIVFTVFFVNKDDETGLFTL